jgi:HEAT repeat protein
MQEEEFLNYVDRIMEEDSFFALIEAGSEIIPKLEVQFWKETFPERRAAIVRIIWEFRNKDTIQFLSEALNESSDVIWKEALNGLITIGGENVRNILDSAIIQSKQIKREWILEAIGQLQKSFSQNN